jgi:hypothetical protein
VKTIAELLPDGRKFNSGYVDPLPESAKRHDSRDWARRILARMNQREHVSALAEQFAKEALAAPGAKR